MKVWFFKEKWKSSHGSKFAYYAFTSTGCHMTDGRNLAEAIYMACDLISCLKNNSTSETIYDEPFEYLDDGIFDDSRNIYIGSLDIDVDISTCNNRICSWWRNGDIIPNTHQFMRVEMLRRAFLLSYKNFKLND